MTDTISDLIIRVSNARMAGLKSVYIPYSTAKEALLKVLKSEGYVGNIVSDKEKRSILVDLSQTLKAFEKIKRVSKPGKRVYVKNKNIPYPKGGYGIVILSTPLGILSGNKARRVGVGGEIICEVF